MGWVRTLLLGDIGNRLDIADAEENISRLRQSQRIAERAIQSKEERISILTEELGRQKLAVQALTRFLIEKGIIAAPELADFIPRIDAEDGVSDGKMELDPVTRQLHFPQPKAPRKLPERPGAS